MKICTLCKQEKPDSEFNFKFKSRGIRQVQCKSCTRSYIREHYTKNRNYYISKAKERNIVQRTLIREYIWTYLNQHPCLDCGEKDPLVLEFDHRENKLMAVSTLVTNNSLEKVIIEIQKCDVRCANCHRRKTAVQFNWYSKVVHP